MDDSEAEGNEECQTVDTSEQSIYIISKEAWEEERNSDFYTLVNLIKMLPDVEINDKEENHDRDGT